MKTVKIGTSEMNLQSLKSLTPSFNKFFEWAAETFTVDYHKQLEAHLEDADNHHDLERRMQVLMRRGMM